MLGYHYKGVDEQAIGAEDTVMTEDKAGGFLNDIMKHNI